MTHPLQLGCVWCAGWSLWMVVASLANTDFAFFGLLAALTLATGGIAIGVNEIDEIHKCTGSGPSVRGWK